MLAFDLPSHGRSGEWDGTGDVHDVSTQMARALLDEPMDLVGHSFGATVALRLAIEVPELVRSVTLFEPVYFAAAMADDPTRWEVYQNHNVPFAKALEAGDMMEAARAFNTGWGDGSGWDATPMELRQYMADRIHFVPASGPFLFGDSAKLLQGDAFSRARMPVLLMRGDQSDEMTGAINVSLARRLPDVREVVMEGVGHMAPITHSSRVATHISEFWAR